jgi:DNA-binding response OmpR family regulator
MNTDAANVLIVDDEPDIREILRIFVTSLGFNPITAADGRQGLEKVKTNHIDVVISDLMMPNVSGMMLLDELRRSGYTNPFIFVTAYPSQEASIQALRLGAFDFLEKPFDGGQVRSLLKEAVRVSKNEGQFNRIVQESMDISSANVARKRTISSSGEPLEKESKRLIQIFLNEIIKQLPVCESSVTSLMLPEVQKWEIGYIMRTMQSFRAVAFSLGLDDISDVSNNLEWLAMRTRLDSELIDEDIVAKFREGFEKLKSLASSSIF